MYIYIYTHGFYNIEQAQAAPRPQYGQDLHRHAEAGLAKLSESFAPSAQAQAMSDAKVVPQRLLNQN